MIIGSVINYLLCLCSGVVSLGIPYEYSVFLFRSCGVGVSGFVTFVTLVSGILDEEVSLFVRGPRGSFTCNCGSVSFVYIRNYLL